MGLEYRILGTLEVVRDESPVAVSAPKERELLVRLLLHANEFVSIDRLADTIWGERPPASAVKLLQLYVSNLRKALGPTAIETAHGAYRIEVDRGDLDSLRFLELLAAARAARGRGRARVAAETFARALALWRGDDVAGGADAAEAGYLEELRLQCLEEHLAVRVELGAHDEVLPALTALCAEHPLRERPVGQLMLALYRAGRQADALAVFRELRQRLDEELGLEPGEELHALERAILRHDPALALLAAPELKLRVPAAATQLIGRSRELAELRTLVQRDEVRLVSLVGAGGSGKTQLALAFAAEATDLFADGVALVELGAVNDSGFVVSAAAAALGVVQQPGEPLEQTIADAIADRELLVVLDNFEQVIDAGPLLLELLAGAPRLTLVVTSRRVLHLSGEQVFTVQPLAAGDAVTLFLARAGAGDAAARVGDGEREAIAEICARLDGLPLAIELAAARARVLTPRQLLERLRASITVLAAGPRDLPARQQTLRDTLAWSFGLLTPEEQASLANVSVFAGGCSLDAATKVADADLDRLAALVDHSLLRRVDGADDEPRFEMLETVREYASEQLADERLARRHSHAWYFAHLAETSELRGPEQQHRLELLDRERDNLRAALDHAADIDDPELELRLSTALWRFWWLRGELAEGRARLEHAILRAAGAEGGLVAQVNAAAAGIAWSQGDTSAARRFAVEGLRATEGADGLAALSCQTVLGLLARDDGNFVSARDHLQASAAIAERLGRESDVYVAKMNLGSVAFESGDYDSAVSLWRDVLAYHRNRDHQEGIAIAVLNLGLVAYRLDDAAAAYAQFAEAAPIFDRIGFREYHVHALRGLAAAAVGLGRAEEAARLLGRAAHLTAAGGEPAIPFAADLAPRAEAEARALLGDAAFAAAFSSASADSTLSSA